MTPYSTMIMAIMAPVGTMVDQKVMIRQQAVTSKGTMIASKRKKFLPHFSVC